jgi:hypothetical protein
LGLRLTLHDENRVLLDVPLTNKGLQDDPHKIVSRELAHIDGDLDSICGICDFFSNRKRVQMVTHMVRDGGNSASFTELLRVAVNPKYVSDLVNRSPGKGLVVKDGKGYRMSPAGLGSFLLLSLGTKKLLKELDDIKNGDKSFEEDLPNEP